MGEERGGEWRENVIYHVSIDGQKSMARTSIRTCTP